MVTRTSRPSASTADGISYDVSFRHHILPELGKLRLDGITRGKTKEFIAKLVGKQLTRPTIRIITAELNAVFNAAMEDEITLENPASRLSKFHKQAPVIHEEIEPLRCDEVVSFLRAAQKYFPENYPLFLCAIHGDLRSGELAGLQWCDIDRNGKFITVRGIDLERRCKPKGSRGLDGTPSWI